VNRDRLLLMEHQNADTSFVILSDVHLDNIIVSESEQFTVSWVDSL